MFLLFARGSAPLAERIERIADRLEEAPAFLGAVEDARGGPQVAVWQRTEARYAADLPGLFARSRAAADGVLDGAALAPPRRGRSRAPTRPLEAYGGWMTDTLADATDDWPLGAERYDELVRLRAFDDLDADAILAIGHEQLRPNLEARRAAAREIDPDADLPSVIDRVKSDRPATFDEALDGYRDVMRRARAYLIEHDIVTIPDDEPIEVIADARVPALGDAVRRVLLARPVRRRPARASTS